VRLRPNQFPQEYCRDLRESRASKEETQNSGLESMTISAGSPNKRLKQLRRTWTSDEDVLLLEAVETHKKFAEKNCIKLSWQAISQSVPGRNAKQSRDRYSSIKCGLHKTPWEKEDDELLLRLHKEIGNHWVEISEHFPTRSDNSLKARFRLLQRRTEEGSCSPGLDTDTDSMTSGSNQEPTVARRKRKKNPPESVQPFLSSMSPLKAEPPMFIPNAPTTLESSWFLHKPLEKSLTLSDGEATISSFPQYAQDNAEDLDKFFEPLFQWM